MGIDLAVISLLDAEHEVDSAASKEVLSEAKVPCRDLEAMKDICRNLCRIDVIVHDVT